MLMWVDLTQPFHEDVPHSPAQPPPSFETLADVRDGGVNVQRYHATTHVGTHVDAPRHVVPEGATIDDLALDRFVGEGVVLDVPQATTEELAVADVEVATGTEEVRPGDIVLFHTGWGGNYLSSEYRPYPWLSTEVAEWLVAREARLVGVDTPSPDRPRAFRPDGWTAYPVHRTLLENGVLIAENLALDGVAGERIELYGFPVKIRNGDGAPARFVARV
jgi:arylformamidase